MYYKFIEIVKIFILVPSKRVFKWKAFGAHRLCRCHPLNRIRRLKVYLSLLVIVFGVGYGLFDLFSEPVRRLMFGCMRQYALSGWGRGPQGGIVRKQGPPWQPPTRGDQGS